MMARALGAEPRERLEQVLRGGGLRLAPLSGHAGDPAPDEPRSGWGACSRERLPDQHRAGRRGGRGRAGGGAPERAHRGRRARRLRAGAPGRPPGCSRWRTWSSSHTSAAPPRRPASPWACARWRICGSSSAAARFATGSCDRRRCCEPFAAGALPESADPAAASAAAYATEVVELLSGLLLELVRERAARSRAGAPGRAAGRGSLSPELLARTLQVQGIWFQLLSIAEQNAAMRRRRQIETERGHEQLRGTFAQVISSAAASGVKAEEIRALLERLRVRPVITAHPTEAKRVTVLEKHRRIYRRLVDLESPRWTPRERQAAGRRAAERDRAALARPASSAWPSRPCPRRCTGVCTSSTRRCSRRCPTCMEKVERALAHVLSGRVLPGAALLPVRLLGRRRPGRQSVRHQRGHPQHAAGEPADRGSPLPPAPRRAGPRAEHHRARRCRCRIGSGRRWSGSSPLPEKARRSPPATRARSSGSTWRRMLRRLEVMIRATERGESLVDPAGYASADALIADLKLIETELLDGGPSGAAPRRWCARCGARWRRSASAPYGSTSGRTPPS